MEDAGYLGQVALFEDGDVVDGSLLVVSLVEGQSVLVGDHVLLSDVGEVDDVAMLGVVGVAAELRHLVGFYFFNWELA